MARTSHVAGRRPRRRRPALLVCLGGLVAATLLTAGTFQVLEQQRRAKTRRWANEAVTEKVRAAEERLEVQDWDRAVTLLEQALATEDATELGPAREALDRAKQGQAAALLAAAEAAARRRDFDEARRLLRDYLAHSHAADRPGATRFCREIDQATSDEQAVALLQRLPETALGGLARGGDVPEINQVSREVLRDVHRETLLRHLPREQERRAELRRLAEAEWARRDARVRATPVFRELREFVELTRKRAPNRGEPARNEDELFAYLFKELGVTDPVEKEKLVKQLRGKGGKLDVIEENVSRKRAHVKERFRAYKDFDAADAEVFDRAVDQELDKLLEELRKGA